MKQIALLSLLVSSALAFGADIQIKPGLWESKVLKQTVDGRDMTAQMAAFEQQAKAMAAQLPPEQRKQLTLQNDHRACVPPSIATNYGAWIEHSSQCKLTSSPSLLGNKLHFDATCMQNGQSASGTGEVVFSGDTVTAHMDLVTADGQGGQHKVQTDWQSKYLGTDCKGHPPIDQVMKGLSSAN